MNTHRIKTGRKVAALSGAFWFACAIPCLACYNDTSVARGEEQFRSQYNAPARATVQEKLEVNPWSIGAMCVGTALATASTIVAIGRFKRPSK